MIAEVKTNQVKNEEFKIWRKSLPSLYQHITTLQPTFASNVEELSTVQKGVTFSDELEVYKEKGLLKTTLYYSMGSDIYEVAFQLPLGVCYDDEDELPQPNYDQFVSDPLQPKWVYHDGRLSKIKTMSKKSETKCDAIAMADDGSLAWFRHDYKNPVRVFSETDDLVSHPMMNSLKQSHNGRLTDFDVSPDTQKIVKSQSVMDPTSIGTSVWKLIDNAERSGDLLHTVRLPGTTVTNNLRFHNNNLFSSCSDDNYLRFWDIRADDSPICIIKDSTNGKLISHDVCNVIDTLFVTGSDTGAIKLWDLRSVLASSKKNEDNTPIVTLFQSNNDAAVDVQFERNHPENIVSVGKTGNVYHWSLQPLLEEQYADEENDTTNDDAYQELLQNHCLKFLHTGGGRRSYGDLPKRGTVALNPNIEGVVATVDDDGFLNVYKAFYGRDDESDDGSTDKP